MRINGNTKTNLMHLYTLNELNKMHLTHEMELKKICPEQDVLIHSKNNSCFNHGSFDFLVETKQNKLIGMEVLTRPSKGKMKNKLRYADKTDEFVFVLPFNSMDFYRKQEKVFHKNSKQKFFGKEFDKKNLLVWLLDLRQGKFTQKAPFNKVFNVK